MRLTKQQLKRIIREEYTRLKRRGLINEMGPGRKKYEQVKDEYGPNTPVEQEETEDEYYDRLAAEYEEMEDGRYEREDAMYRKQIGESRRRRIRESRMKELYGECQNEVYAMAQENGYVCHLCVSQAIESCGMGPADMHLCCQIIEDCILSGMLEPGSCPKYPEVTVYFPVM